ncbi:hypothetical protein Tco_1253782 [Tanacetum coccineum]
MNVEALHTKYPILDWEIYTEGARKYWKIIRVGNHSDVYQFFDDMLKAFDREDLVKLWSLVKEKFTSTKPTKDKERKYGLMHHVSTKDGLDIYMLVEREYPLSRGVLTHMLVAKILVEQDSEMSREILSKIFMQGFAAVLAILVTGASQSRQHVDTSSIHIESCKSPTKSLFDVGSSRISIFTVNT